MKKILFIDKRENYTICLFEHRLFEICDHLLISFSLHGFPEEQIQRFEGYDSRLTTEAVSEDNLHYLKGSDFNYNTMHHYIVDKTEPAEGFVTFTKDTHEPVGFIWLMYKGGSEAQYRIRNIDAFGFYFFVFPKFRGNQYIEYFIYNMLKYLKTKKIEKLYASVRKNNAAALRAYEKAGMKIEAPKKFYRFIKWRIPYPII